MTNLNHLFHLFNRYGQMKACKGVMIAEENTNFPIQQSSKHNTSITLSFKGDIWFDVWLILGVMKQTCYANTKYARSQT